ncbi:bifunctional biotin--[acetyl-CoA-carboxylase] ligase/biotin operon repressor BirA [Vibrio sp. SCSIO 43136]|uniref:bifunctional biotin--[acetyl-CoA-carboxylase] ligase/biotin operon repressor BirA n=1 Tax=Vibrio sp. SCSIO 43136 TaxID=2819101 RepID=UPI0020757183|nr:bifunctional biotin--[acetyl-CoA-carboxylase] ligase/biotin operon repressor BirA [Vibrio sp. SCSIO 43136]USD65416.1 bifunctional biotin--[acetyl-CoA-carboxylase] ligase/biotin operon repressor BirA [Vibrio sp. SCSIO 43136]
MKGSSLKYALVELLADGEFHSGEALGHTLGVSRAAISKHIKSIQSLGLDVFSVPRKGYKLTQPISLLCSEKISPLIERPVSVFPVIDSTNQYLMDQMGSLDSGHVCLAEYQSSGRGRRGRTWVSPFATNLYMSMYWRLEAGMAAAMGLSLVIGIATTEALDSLGYDGVKLKWPNDIYYQDTKLAGILVEMSGQAGGAAELVIGLGLNVAMPESETEAIDQPWTALEKLSAGSLPIDRNELAATILQHWQQALAQYEGMGMSAFIERWNRFDNYVGRPVTLLMGPNQVTGIVQGINEQGAVLIETDKGVEAFIGGEISLRAKSK